MAREIPVFAPPKKKQTLEQMIERDAASKWKRDFQGNGTPVDVKDLPTYAEWKARKEADKK